jgi:hypothetical protein
MQTGDVLVYPTFGGRCRNPYFVDQDKDRMVLQHWPVAQPSSLATLCSTFISTATSPSRLLTGFALLIVAGLYLFERHRLHAIANIPTSTQSSK